MAVDGHPGVLVADDLHGQAPWLVAADPDRHPLAAPQALATVLGPCHEGSLAVSILRVTRLSREAQW